jgi:hypothetical protein
MGFRLSFWNNAISTRETPSQEDLNRFFLIVLSQLNYVGMINTLNCVCVLGVKSTDWTVCNWMNFLLLKPFYEFFLSTLWVKLDLVYSWLDFSVSQHIGKELNVKVGYADALC